MVKQVASEEKLSMRLAKLLEPFRKPGMGTDEYEGLLKLAAMAWNLSLMAEEKRRQAIDHALDDFPVERDLLQPDLDMLVDRKLALFPNDRRLIADMSVTDLGDGRVNVIVASTTDV